MTNTLTNLETILSLKILKEIIISPFFLNFNDMEYFYDPQIIILYIL